MAASFALPSALQWSLDATNSCLPFAGSFHSSCRRDKQRFHTLLPRCSFPSSEAPISRSSKTREVNPSLKNGKKGSKNLADDPFPRRRGSDRKHPLWRRIFFASKKVRSIIILDVLTIIYASDIAVLKEVETTVDPSLFNVIRFSIAALPFLPFVLWFRGDTKTRSFGIELGIWASLGYLTQSLGLLTSGAGRASFLSAFMVITVPLIDGFLGSTVPFLTWCGALVSLVGACLLECSGSPPNVGDLLSMMSAVFFGVHMLRTEHISRIIKKESYLSLLGYQVSVIAFVSIGWYILQGTPFEGDKETLESWASFPWIPALYTGILTTGLCLWAEMSAMCDVSASETAIIYGLEPLWGAAFAWILLGERWDAVGWIGAALILSGSMAVQIFGSSLDKSKADHGKRRADDLVISERSKDLTFSPVVIKRVRDLPDK